MLDNSADANCSPYVLSSCDYEYSSESESSEESEETEGEEDTENEGEEQQEHETMIYDVGDCLHEHQEADVKSYIRCGVKRPFTSAQSSS